MENYGKVTAIKEEKSQVQNILCITFCVKERKQDYAVVFA